MRPRYDHHLHVLPELVSRVGREVSFPLQRVQITHLTRRYLSPYPLLTPYCPAFPEPAYEVRVHSCPTLTCHDAGGGLREQMIFQISDVRSERERPVAPEGGPLLSNDG